MKFFINKVGSMHTKVEVKLLFFAFIFHYLAYIFMQTLALFAELQRGPVLNDFVLDKLIFVSNLSFITTTFWSIMLVASLIMLSIFKVKIAIDYLRIGAVVSIFRGIFISLTTLGPPSKVWVPDVMKKLTFNDINFSLLIKQWIPIDVLSGGSGISAAYLTQDLFFSGHTATTFLFLLLVPRQSKLFYIFLIYHVITVVALFLSHLHYSIDILGAYFIVYAIYSFMRKKNWLQISEKI